MSDVIVIVTLVSKLAVLKHRYDKLTPMHISAAKHFIYITDNNSSL